MDAANLVPEIAKLIGIAPSTLLLYIGLVTMAANVGARLIPNDATGFLGRLRVLCSIVGVYVSSRVSSGVSVNDVAAAALKTPPIPDKVEGAKNEADNGQGDESGRPRN